MSASLCFYINRRWRRERCLADAGPDADILDIFSPVAWLEPIRPPDFFQALFSFSSAPWRCALDLNKASGVPEEKL